MMGTRVHGSSSSSSSLLRYGHTALVTGASSGIGESFCRRLAEMGFSTIVVVARREDRLRRLQHEIEAGGVSKVVPIVIDLSHASAVKDLYEELLGRGIEVDVVVNNAGFGILGNHETIHPDKVSDMVNVNCRAVVEVALQFLPGMKRRGRGAMIITSSVVGAIPAPWFAAYSATKAFDLYFGEALHAECKGSGVDVVTVLPGLTRTEFHAGAGSRDYHAPYRTAAQVVNTACRALGRKSIVVDGLFNKLLVHGTRFIPRGLLLWISRLVMKAEVVKV